MSSMKNEVIEEIWRCVQQEEKLPREPDADLKLVMRVMDVLRKCYHYQSVTPIEKSTLSASLQKQLYDVVSKTEFAPRSDFDWSVDVIAGNSHVQKSMQIITNIKLGGENYEFDLEQFAKLRYNLAKTVLSVRKYE
ncbi:unnamed protein product [Auanema sp. JU1783]|nr:unnamed protein product [Auanema sp. JU1783]